MNPEAESLNGQLQVLARHDSMTSSESTYGASTNGAKSVSFNLEPEVFCIDGTSSTPPQQSPSLNQLQHQSSPQGKGIVSLLPML